MQLLELYNVKMMIIANIPSYEIDMTGSSNATIAFNTLKNSFTQSVTNGTFLAKVKTASASRGSNFTSNASSLDVIVSDLKLIEITKSPSFAPSLGESLETQALGALKQDMAGITAAYVLGGIIFIVFICVLLFCTFKTIYIVKSNEGELFTLKRHEILYVLTNIHGRIAWEVVSSTRLLRVGDSVNCKRKSMFSISNSNISNSYLNFTARIVKVYKPFTFRRGNGVYGSATVNRKEIEIPSIEHQYSNVPDDSKFACLKTTPAVL